MTRKQVTGYDRSSLLGGFVLVPDSRLRPHRSTPEGHGLPNMKLLDDLWYDQQKRTPAFIGRGPLNFTPEALRMLPVEVVS